MCTDIITVHATSYIGIKTKYPYAFAIRPTRGGYVALVRKAKLERGYHAGNEEESIQVPQENGHVRR